MPLAVPTSQPCPTCHGTGAKPGTSPKVCPVCNGRGVEAQSQGIFSISQPCSHCHGSGTVIERPVPDLRGQRRAAQRPAPAGQHPGRCARRQPDQARGQGRARACAGAPPGDLYVITRVTASPVFKWSGDNLEVEVPLTIPEAIRGAVVEVPTLNGTKRLRVPRGDQARHRPAPARRGPAAARRQGQRRPALPVRDRRSRDPLGRAGPTPSSGSPR